MTDILPTTKAMLTMRLAEDLQKLRDANLKGGPLRKYRGEVSVETVSAIFKSAAEELGIADKTKILNGLKDKKIYAYHEARRHRSDTGVLKRYSTSLDQHVYVGDKFAAAVETKSYVDIKDFSRFCAYGKLIKKTSPQTKTVLIAIEAASSDCGIGAFYEGVGGADRVFTLYCGGRSSDKPLHLMPRDIDGATIDQMLEFIQTTLVENLDAI